MSGQCVAMWSGPRNISTAMMRSWENRSDTVVEDEPFYAHFLKETGIDHPMAREVIAAGNTDLKDIIEKLRQAPASGIFYQKHITTHWMEYFPVDWLADIKHVFLIREPSRVVASYAVKRRGLTAFDLGYAQQAMLFDLISEQQGRAPLVIDSARFLEDPESQLRAVCEHLEIDFEDAMLHWPAGQRDSDGLWACHWYDAVIQSTGFGPVNNKPLTLSPEQQQIVDSCQAHYQIMSAHTL